MATSGSIIFPRNRSNFLDKENKASGTGYECKIAYLPEKFNYIGDLTVMENLYFNFMVILYII